MSKYIDDLVIGTSRWKKPKFAPALWSVNERLLHDDQEQQIYLRDGIGDSAH